MLLMYIVSQEYGPTSKNEIDFLSWLQGQTESTFIQLDISEYKIIFLYI